MGVCASCLGLDRHPSHETDESDPLLDDEHAQYGGTTAGDMPQPDEEELRKEREILDQITTEATENMIDVLHSGTTELSQRFAPTGGQQGASGAKVSDETTKDTSATQGGEDSALLRNIQSAGVDATAVKGLEAGTQLIDPSQLRVEPPTSAPRKSTKGKLPA